MDRWDPEQHMVIIRPVTAWAAQAEEAMAEITAANGGRDVARIADAAEIAPAAFGRLVEAMVALESAGGPRVGDDLIALARLRPVDEVLGDE